MNPLGGVTHAAESPQLHVVSATGSTGIKSILGRPPNELVAPSFYESVGWLSMIEASDELQATYFCAHLGEELRGILPTYQWNGAPGPLTQHNDLYRTVLARLLGADRGVFSPVFFAGTIGGFTNDLALLSVPSDPIAARAVLGAGERDAAAKGAPGIVFPYLTAQAAVRLQTLLGPRTTLLAAEPSAYFSTNWSDRESYLATLSGQRRRSARREMRTFIDCGCTVIVTRVDGHVDAIAPLLLSIQQHHGLDSSQRVVRYLHNLAAALNEHSVLVLVELEERLVAFCLGFWQRDTLHMHKIGLNYGQSAKCAVYFNAAYYVPLDIAASMSLNRVELGPGALPAKLMRGASLETRWFGLVGFDHLRGLASVTRAWNRRQYMKLQQLAQQYGRTIPEDEAALYERSVA